MRLQHAANGKPTIRLECPLCGTGPHDTILLGSIDFGEGSHDGSLFSS